MRVLDIIKELIKDDVNFDLDDFYKLFLANLEKRTKKKITHNENNIFVGNQEILEYLKENNMDSIFVEEIARTSNEYRKREVKVNDLIRGVSLGSGKDAFFEIVGKRGVIAVIPKPYHISSDIYREGKIFYLIVERIMEEGKISFVVSRRKNIIVEKLFSLYCKEIQEGKISIVSIARNPGERTKVLIQSTKENSFGILSLIGKNSYIINAISNELNEVIQVFEFIPDKIKETYIKLMYPIDVEDIEINEDSVEYFIKERDLPKAIGKNGSNIRLISMLINKKVTVKSK